MAKKGYRFESEVHLGLLGIIALLLLLNVLSNYVSYSARSVQREKGVNRLQSTAVQVSRQLQAEQFSHLSPEVKQRYCRDYNLADLALLAPRPEPWNDLTSRQWLITVAEDLPISRVGQVADRLMSGEARDLEAVENDLYMFSYPVREGNGERLLVVVAELPELAALERGARLVFYSGGVASLLVLAIYLILSRRIFWPLRKIRKAATAAGLNAVIDDSAESVVEEYERIIAELRQKEAELRHSNAVVTEMSAGMAHQLRNSLAAISGFGTLLRRQLHKRGEETISVEALLDETHEAKELITRFLDLSRPMHLERMTVVLADFLDDVQRSVRANPALAGCNLEFEPVIECELSLDPLLLKQAIINLIDNAAKAYGVKPGKILVRIRVIQDDLSITIQDWAGGISPGVRDKLFTPFVSSRPSGTGLGLVFVSRVVSAHSGSVEVDSVVGEGSRFTLNLPHTMCEKSNHPSAVSAR